MTLGVCHGSILLPLPECEDLNPGKRAVTVRIGRAEQKRCRAAPRDTSRELQIFPRHVESKRSKAAAGSRSAAGVALRVDEMALPFRNQSERSTFAQARWVSTSSHDNSRK
jgi:hypothetical protein